MCLLWWDIVVVLCTTRLCVLLCVIDYCIMLWGYANRTSWSGNDIVYRFNKNRRSISDKSSIEFYDDDDTDINDLIVSIETLGLERLKVEGCRKSL